jgi:hypothetical protein
MFPGLSVVKYVPLTTIIITTRACQNQWMGLTNSWGMEHYQKENVFSHASQGHYSVERLCDWAQALTNARGSEEHTHHVLQSNGLSPKCC